MRLLRCTNLSLHDFFDDEVPQYAILSHTWSKGREVSHQDLQLLNNATAAPPNDTTALDRIRGRSGYEKIVRCAQRARSDGWEWVWIDTCCIEKSSSAELSEAINSMYQWYSRSAVCYAHLSDVSKGGGDESLTEQLWECVWFKRGWTLQELLAPREVRFYDRNWSYIGHKSKVPFAEPFADFIDLSQTVSNITGIGLDTLSDGIVERASIARRMSWAAQRKTSRREDSAYCLLGLFNINMPLLYGEGDKAFIRLQEEIVKTSDDHSIFAWRNHKIEDPRTRYSGMLAPSVDAFIGAGYIIRAGSQSERRPYSMTNMGLRIELPLRNAESSRNRVLCVLNCRYDMGTGTTRLAVYLAEPWTMDSNVFMASKKPGRLLSGGSELHSIARDNAMLSPVQTPRLTKEERTRSSSTLYVGAFTQYDPTQFVDCGGSIYIRRFPQDAIVTSAYPNFPRGQLSIWPLQLPHRLGVFLIVAPNNPRSLTMVILRSASSTELPAAACVLELSAPSFTPSWPTEPISHSCIMRMLYGCLRHGKDYGSPSYVTCNMARKSFGDVLVADMHDTLTGELPHNKNVPAMLSQGLPQASDVEALQSEQARLSMPANLCLRVRFRTQAEVDALLGSYEV